MHQHPVLVLDWVGAEVTGKLEQSIPGVVRHQQLVRHCRTTKVRPSAQRTCNIGSGRAKDHLISSKEPYPTVLVQGAGTTKL